MGKRGHRETMSQGSRLVKRMSGASYLNGVDHPEKAILMNVPGLVCGFDKTSSQVYA